MKNSSTPLAVAIVVSAAAIYAGIFMVFPIGWALIIGGFLACIILAAALNEKK